MTATAIGDFYSAVEEFTAACRSAGAEFDGPSIPREELAASCASLEGLDTELLLDATIQATGYNCDSQLGDAPFRGVEVMPAVESVESGYRNERIRAAALVEGAARCGSAVDDVTRVSSTSISSCLGAGSELLTLFSAMMGASFDRAFSAGLVEAGSELIELCLSYSESEIAERDECVSGALEQFASDCECHCTAVPEQTPPPPPPPPPAPEPTPPPSPEPPAPAPAPPAEPVGIKPPPPELAEVPEPPPPPKKMQSESAPNHEAGQW